MLSFQPLQHSATSEEARRLFRRLDVHSLHPEQAPKTPLQRLRCEIPASFPARRGKIGVIFMTAITVCEVLQTDTPTFSPNHRQFPQAASTSPFMGMSNGPSK